MNFNAFFLWPRKDLYRCHIDGKFLFGKFHLSGILFFKHNEDKSTRVVFTNEMGYTFFDFGYYFIDSFVVHSIIPKLNKPALVKTLRQDLELLLVLNPKEIEFFRRDDSIYYRSVLQKGFAYFIVDNKTRNLQRVEVAGKRLKTTIYSFPKRQGREMSDSFSIVHHTGHFTINAKKIKDD